MDNLYRVKIPNSDVQQ